MKSNQDHQRIAAAFERLFRTYGPLGQGNSPEEIALDRMERIKVYFDAVVMYDERDVEAAVDAILDGSAPGINFNFAPAAPAVGAECRRRMNLRLDSEHRAKMARPALPPPDVERTPEARARVKAMVDKALGNLKSVTADEDAATAQRKAEMWAKTNARFNPSADEAEMAARLWLHRWRS